jgi:hypothetical protein
VKAHTYKLLWFDAPGEDLAGEETLPITDEQVREWFWLCEEENPVGGSHIVRASQRAKLQPVAKHEIDLNKWDYFVEAEAEA